MVAPPVLTLSHLHHGYDALPLFDAINVSILEEARLCLIGRNGSGKSTVLKIMAGLVDPQEGERFVRPGKSVGYMDQDPDLTEYPTLRNYAIAGLPEADAYRADIVAEGLNLDLNRASQTASGGERRRAALVKIFAEDPDLMLLDEPTNHLDILAITWLEDHLRVRRKAFVLVSHDRMFLRNLTQGILWLDRGVLRQHPKGFEAFEAWRDATYDAEDMHHHKLKQLIKSEARWAVEGISARRKRNQGRLRRLTDLRAKQSEYIQRKTVSGMTFEAGQKSGKLVVEAVKISKAFKGQSIIKDFSLRVTRGARLALVGPNGVGKTTLLNMLTGQLQPDAGKIRLGTKLTPVVFDQNRAGLNPDLSLWNTLTHDKELGISGKNDQIMVRDTPKHVVGYLKEFLFDAHQVRGPVSALSGGEKARLLLAKIMARPSNMLILDEPTNDLDVETLDILQEVLDRYDGTVILVSHDRDFLDRFATVTIAIEEGGHAIAYAGGWSDYQRQRRLSASGPQSKTTAAHQVKSPMSVASKPKQKKSGLTFTQKHRLTELPDVIEALEKDIAKLQTLLSDAELYAKDPVKFEKAADLLAERQSALQTLEEEWMMLETIAEKGQGA